MGFRGNDDKICFTAHNIFHYKIEISITPSLKHYPKVYRHDLLYWANLSHMSKSLKI